MEKRTQVLERGNIYFLYRPRVQREDVRDFRDVQRLYMVLSPQDKQRFRTIVMPKKQLPEVGDEGQRFWGFIEKVARDPKEIVEQELGREQYGAARFQAAARPAGEGVYAIVWHRDHTHLTYMLELPAQPGDVQQQLNIQQEGSYFLSVKNPDQPSPPGIGLDEEQKAKFPKELQDKFGGRRFIDLDPPDFLDYEGAEILLIGAEEELSDELGIELHPEDESEASAEIFNELRITKSEQTIKPLFKGQWA
jgi:hypothetical protein